MENQSLNDLLKNIEVVENKHTDMCKGLFFRGFSSCFFDKETGRIERRTGLRLLKKMSCSGCPSCSFLFEDIEESLSSRLDILPDSIKEGAIYGCHIINQTTDWETGYLDGWDLEFYEIQEKKESGS